MCSAAGDHLERPRYADQAGQALGAAAARQDAELDFRQAETRRCVRDAEVASHRHLQTAAQRGAVDGRHERLGRPLDHAPDLVRVRRQAWLAELADIGAGDERSAAADDHRGLHLGVIGNCRHRRREPFTDVLAQRIDRRVVDPDCTDDAESRLLVTFDGYGLAHLHGDLLPWD